MISNTRLRFLSSLMAIGVVSIAGCLSAGGAEDNADESNSALDGAACVVNFSVANQWSGGFQASITLKNQSGAAYNGWKLTYTAPGDQKIQSLWGGKFSQSGSAVTVDNESWNGSLAPGAAADIGFVGAGSAGKPTDFAVNGVACNGASGSTSSTTSSSTTSGAGGSTSSTTTSGAGGSTSSTTTSGAGGGATSGAGGGTPSVGNPFTGATWYVNPDYAKEIDISIADSPADAALLSKVKSIPTFIWLDRIAMVSKIAGYLNDADKQQKASGKPMIVPFVVYDLPNRDCAALASNGELHLDSGGAQKYKTDYIDPIAAEFKKHPNLRIVAVVEPDSLPNIATNLDRPTCAAAKQGYLDSTAYAIKNLAMPNVSMYLDSAHSGWLGWTDNQTKMAKIFKQVLDAAGGTDLIRGFATNVSNYTVLDATKGTPDIFPYQGNPCHDELTFVSQISKAFEAEGIKGKGFIIDTSRNGRGGIRHDWGYWCNNMGAGMGERPQANPAPGIDAYVWVKPPGESDGVSDPTQPRYDGFCGKEDAAKNAPQAGQWFSSYFIMTAKNANPPL